MASTIWRATSLNGYRIGITRTIIKTPLSQTLKDLQSARSKRCVAGLGSSLQSVSAQATETGARWIAAQAGPAFDVPKTLINTADLRCSACLRHGHLSGFSGCWFVWFLSFFEPTQLNKQDKPNKRDRPDGLLSFPQTFLYRLQQRTQQIFNDAPLAGFNLHRHRHPRGKMHLLALHLDRSPIHAHARRID